VAAPPSKQANDAKATNNPQKPLWLVGLDKKRSECDETTNERAENKRTPNLLCG
jgi:hypothetical protein